ncbi:MAG: formimidoylglutamate deiminase, partial [Gammaproteobacteria bacterium]
MKRVIAKDALLGSDWVQDLEVEIGSDGRIAAIGPVSGKDGQAVDLLLPAPVNVHSHSFQRAMAGLTEARGCDASDSFWTWRTLIYQYLQHLTPEDIEAIATQVFMEALEAG